MHMRKFYSDTKEIVKFVSLWDQGVRQKRSFSSYSVEDEIAMAGYDKRKCSYHSEDSIIRLEGYSKTVSTSNRIYVSIRDSNSLSFKYEATAVDISRML